MFTKLRHNSWREKSKLTLIIKNLLILFFLLIIIKYIG